MGLTLLVLAVLLANLLLQPDDRVTWTGRCMGVLSYEVKIAQAGLIPPRRARLQQSVNQMLWDINQAVSTYVEESEISRFNRHRSTEPFPVSPLFADLVRDALAVSAETEGRFDPTLGPLIELWGFGAAGARIDAPSEAEVAAARERTGWPKVRVLDGPRLAKDHPELELNLSAIACGWAVDRIADRLAAAGLKHYYVNLSGEVRCAGVNFEGGPWRLGIPRPDRDPLRTGPVWRRVAVQDRGLATSGDYHNYFQDEDGRYFSHTLDPRTGWPVAHALCSVSVVAPTAALADAYGTALLVMGVEPALAWLNGRPGVEALLISRTQTGLEERATPGFPFVEEAVPAAGNSGAIHP
jgi:thiamine biosynthesis lipoprotein